MKNKITIIDYGVGNLLSISKAIEKCGFECLITSNIQLIADATHLILPGVGAFKYAMKELKKRKLDTALKLAVKKNAKVLGICLGMQLFFENSEEFGSTEGLGFIKGNVIPVPDKDLSGKNQKIPIIGWYEMNIVRDNNADLLIFNSKKSNFVYFVHSFMAKLKDKNNIIAHYNYGGYEIPAIIKKNNIYGCQFHPEKSGNIGIEILKKFCALNFK